MCPDLQLLVFCISSTRREKQNDCKKSKSSQHQFNQPVLHSRKHSTNGLSAGRSRPGPELTTLEAVGNQWRYTLVVVEVREEVLYSPLRSCVHRRLFVCLQDYTKTTRPFSTILGGRWYTATEETNIFWW